MIVNLKKGNSIFAIVILLVLMSCSKNDEQYAYAHYFEKDSIPSNYFVINVHYEGDDRTDIVLSSKAIEGPFEQVSKERYCLKKGGLDKVIMKGGTSLQKPYLTTLNNECIDFLFGNGMDDVMASTLCFLRRENIVIGDIEYKNAYKFRKIKGKLDGVESKVYYDTNFILLKEEYVSGYTDDFRIVRIDTPVHIPR